MNNNEKLFSCAGKICRDSREIKPGQVFVAFKREKYDGHDFVKSAFEKGAIKAIVNHKIDGVDEEKLIIVKDTSQAIQEIAIYNRETSKALVIAVTGSSGKTSTKEMLKKAFENQGKIYATEGNLNNTIGMPLTLANMPLDTEIAILEMGMNHAGEVDYMTKIAKPDIAIITNIGNAHHEFFPNSIDIAKAKAEIFNGMNEKGSVFLYKDDFFEFLCEKALEKTKNIFSFGDEGDVKLLSYDNGNCKIDLFGEEISYQLSMKGRHQAINSLAVLGIVKKINKDTDTAIKNISTMSALKGRGQISNIKFKNKNITLIDEAYNANPDSMKTAINSLREFKGKRKIAVLGEMRELGEKSLEFHKDLLPAILNAGIDIVYCCCSDMRALYDILPLEKQGAWTENSLQLWQHLEKDIKEEDIIFVKGSLGSNMLLIIDCIKSNK